ncbi:TetR/AcrR family transcriptional regulator [Sphingomonas sp. SRS2]|uniref:TetR/AcrR family transcriptional regulator n=1 Tax=Sphingomonas sp. SRS2 TaxID=133190 RepID=UPI0006184140|nr:TetR/AcrR family transcriptional regulator [Sphingomonas sp. SRS2]KKC23894.1 TetR family transcriptional regulator [Sphingomonas sp. SRS2]
MKLEHDKPALGRREARRIDRRDAILAIAATSFMEQGYSATSMSAIASAVGGSKATMWNYFPSKQALFEAVLERATSAHHAEMTSLLDASGGLEETLRRFCLRFVQKITSPPAIALHRLVHAESGRFPEVGQIFYERAPKTAHAMLARFLAAAMDRGELRSADPIRAARTLVSLCMSGVHQQVLLGLIETPPPELVTIDAEAAMNFFLRAYAP